MNTAIALYDDSNPIDCEILELDSQQLGRFNNKWFIDKTANTYQAVQNINEPKLVKELPNNPLLLTLLYLVVEETGEIPSNRSYLYKEGSNILLKKWDNTRSIERDWVYKKLPLQRKEDLLSQIALKTFERGDYCFNYNELKQYIIDYICNLPDTETNLEVLKLDGEVVLKSIVTQHEILVELTEGIYAFSLLAFHEYFAAKEIVDKSEPQALQKALQELVSHITEARWREIFLLAVSMIRNADYLLSLIKSQTNALLTSEPQLQQFLRWNEQYANSDKAYFKPLALRAFALEFVLNLDFDARRLDKKLAYNLSFNRARISKYTQKLQNFQFSEQQQKVLKQYYDANKLLLDCLNNAHYVTRGLRAEIENNLFVPSELM